MSKREPTYELALKQIEGLRKTQAEEVWIRKDIVEFALGECDNEEICLHSSVLDQKETKSRNLIEALEQKTTVMSDSLGCYKRVEVLHLLETWATEVRGKPTLYKDSHEAAGSLSPILDNEVPKPKSRKKGE